LNNEILVNAAIIASYEKQKEDAQRIFAEAGGFLGHDMAGNEMWQKYDGSHTPSSDDAISSYPRNTHTYTIGNIISGGYGVMSYPRPLIRDDGKHCGIVDEVIGPASFAPVDLDYIADNYGLGWLDA
jgi:hypothetical protein